MTTECRPRAGVVLILLLVATVLAGGGVVAFLTFSRAVGVVLLLLACAVIAVRLIKFGVIRPDRSDDS